MEAAQPKTEWPQCGEPYATKLKQFAQQWIEGNLSNGDLALELLELQQLVIYAEREAREDGKRVPITLGATRREIEVLCHALAEYNHTEFDNPPTSRDRQINFEVALEYSREWTNKRGRLRRDSPHDFDRDY